MRKSIDALIEHIHADKIRCQQAIFLHDRGFVDAGEILLSDFWFTLLNAFNLEAGSLPCEHACTVTRVSCSGMFPGSAS